MTTSQTTVAIVQTTDAEFRTWCADVIAGMTAVGLTQTSDTGQINTATVTKPAAANASQGYVIFKFPDALNATVPIYMKVEFGSGTTAATPDLFFTVGTGSDGAGTITNIQYARKQIVLAAGSASVCTNWYSYKAGGFAMALAARSGQATRIFVVERARDADGTANASGWYAAAPNGTSTTSITSYHYNVAAGTNTAGQTFYSVPIAATVSTGWSYGTNVQVFPCYMYTDRVAPLVHILGHATTDFTAGTSFTATVCGSSRTYMPVSVTSAGGWAGGASAYECVAILWE